MNLGGGSALFLADGDWKILRGLDSYGIIFLCCCVQLISVDDEVYVSICF